MFVDKLSYDFISDYLQLLQNLPKWTDVYRINKIILDLTVLLPQVPHAVLMSTDG